MTDSSLPFRQYISPATKTPGRFHRCNQGCVTWSYPAELLVVNRTGNPFATLSADRKKLSFHADAKRCKKRRVIAGENAGENSRLRQTEGHAAQHRPWQTDSLQIKSQTPLHGHRLWTPPTDKNLPHPNTLTCWDEMLGSGIAMWQICCRIVVSLSVGGVRSRCS